MTDPNSTAAPSGGDWSFEDGQPSGEWSAEDGKPLVTQAPAETAGRVAGLGGRALMTGLGQLDDAPTNIAHAVDAGAVWLLKRAGVIHPDYQLPTTEQFSKATGIGGATQAATQTADQLGMPTPVTPGERIGSAAVSALPSAILAPEAPIVGGLSAAAGGAASQSVAEAGGSPLAQTLTGLAVGGAPALGAAGAAGIRGLVRGGAEGAAATNARIADAAASGTQLTAGQATGSGLLQKVEGASSKVWGGGPITAAADKQTAAQGNRVADIVENLSQGGDASPTGAGEAITAGVTTAKQSMRDAERQAYAKVDQLVPPTTPIDVSGALSKLDELATPTAGAEATTGALISPKIAKLREDLQADVAKNGGTLPYSAVRQLRSAIGSNIDPSFAPADAAGNAGLKQIYGALTSDMNSGAGAISPEAQSAVKSAGTLYKVNSAQRDLLESVVNRAGGPEQVFQAATAGTKYGAGKTAAIMGALNPDQQNLVRATVLDRLGRAPANLQSAAGTDFNASTFLTNWAKLDSKAKDSLFGASGTPSTLRASLDSLADTMSTIRNSTLFRNPGGTAAAGGHGAGLWAVLGSLAGEGGSALLGHPHVGLAVGGAAVGGAVLNNLMARALVNPRTARWLATTTRMPQSAIPGAVNALARMGAASNDRDARDLAGYLAAGEPGNAGP